VLRVLPSLPAPALATLPLRSTLMEEMVWARLHRKLSGAFIGFLAAATLSVWNRGQSHTKLCVQSVTRQSRELACCAFALNFGILLLPKNNNGCTSSYTPTTYHHHHHVYHHTSPKPRVSWLNSLVQMYRQTLGQGRISNSPFSQTPISALRSREMVLTCIFKFTCLVSTNSQERRNLELPLFSNFPFWQSCRS
jgi:hypothetical protein